MAILVQKTKKELEKDKSLGRKYKIYKFLERNKKIQ